MLIKIDFRETDLYAACEKILASPDYLKSNVKITACGIPLGDIIICEEDEKQTEKIIIERKTLDDLAASIRDGRYAEQSFRLNECTLHNHNIFYAIEGDLRHYKSTSFSKNKIDKKSLLSALTSIHYYKGFSLMRTINVTETAEWLIQMADKIQREQVKNKALPFYSNIQSSENLSVITINEDVQQTIQSNKEYVNVVANKRIKKDNITSQNIGEIMLMQIPGVSANAAIAIMRKYGTILALIKALEETNIINSPLKDINIHENEADKKPRKINKPTILNVYKYLINNTEKINIENI